jgi:hypothetical protein
LRFDVSRIRRLVPSCFKITATITAIDPNVPSITLAGPNNWTYSSRVADKAALKQVKVGDRLDITWTSAVLVSADSPKVK